MLVMQCSHLHEIQRVASQQHPSGATAAAEQVTVMQLVLQLRVEWQLQVVALQLLLMVVVVLLLAVAGVVEEVVAG